MAKCTKKEPGINILILWVRVFVSYVCTHLVLLFPSPLRCSNDGRGIGHTSLKKKIATMLAVIRQIRGTKAFGAMDNVYENSTKKRASRASALRADGVPLRVDF